MAGRVCVHAQRLFLVVGAVVEKCGAKLQGTLVLCVQLLLGWHAEVQVELLRDARFGPGRSSELTHLPYR